MTNQGPVTRDRFIPRPNGLIYKLTEIFWPWQKKHPNFRGLKFPRDAFRASVNCLQRKYAHIIAQDIMALMEAILKLDPDCRFTATQCLGHHAFNDRRSVRNHSQPPPLSRSESVDSSTGNIKHWSASTVWTQLIGIIFYRFSWTTRTGTYCSFRDPNNEVKNRSLFRKNFVICLIRYLQKSENKAKTVFKLLL